MRAMIARKCLVSGRVQGVFYRATAARRGQELGLRDHARNLADGRVEVVVAGPPEQVSEFVAWLWVGSSGARVTGVTIEEHDAAAVHPDQGFLTG